MLGALRSIRDALRRFVEIAPAPFRPARPRQIASAKVISGSIRMSLRTEFAM
jgi:hypothetical protein